MIIPMAIEKGKCRSCDKPALKRGLCNAHYIRLRRHGEIVETAHYRARVTHPLYKKWIAAKVAGVVDDWQDFAVFVAGVGDQPSKACKLRKRHVGEPMGPDNFRWIAQRTAEEKAALIKAGVARRYYGKKLAGEPIWTDGARDSFYRRKFGITLGDYRAMETAQNGLCAICRQQDVNKRLAVDHCHSTGVVRGLLCEPCNLSIGRMGDDPDRLEAAAQYIRANSLRRAA